MEGDISSFFMKDLGLALAPKMCPGQSQTFKEVNNSQTFTVKKYPFFWTSRFQVLQGMFVQSLAQKLDDLSAEDFYFPAQLVGGFTLSDLVDKPWSQVSPLVPPRHVPSIFIAHRAQHSRCSSIFIECC